MTQPYKRKYFLDSETPPREGKKWNLKRIKLIGFSVGGAVLLCVLLALVWSVVRGPRTMPRERFEEAVIGKTKDEVTQALGEAQGWGPDFLLYNSRTHDKATRQADRSVMIKLDEKTGKCVSVSYMR